MPTHRRSPLILVSIATALAIAYVGWRSIGARSDASDPGTSRTSGTFRDSTRGASSPDHVPSPNVASSDNARRESTRSARPGGSCPSSVDSLHLLLAFGWSVDDVLDRLAARTVAVRDQVLERLLAARPDDEITEDAEFLLAALARLEPGGDELARSVFAWADRPQTRQLARPIARALIHQGSEGRRLAAELAIAQWKRAVETPKERVAYLCASYTIEELAKARATEAVPALRELAQDALERWTTLAVQIDDQVAQELGALPDDPDQAHVQWQANPLSDRAEELAAWRRRAEEVHNALIAIDAPEVAQYVERTLSQARTAQLDRHLTVLVNSLAETLPTQPSGPVAKALEPWVIEGLESRSADSAWARPMICRVAGIYGAKAVPGLLDAIEGNPTARLRDASFAALAQAVALAPDADGARALRHFVSHGPTGGDSPTTRDAYVRALGAVVALNDPQDDALLLAKLEDSPPAEIAVVLQHVPETAWRERPQALAAVLERLEPQVAESGDAGVALDLAVDLLVRTQDDPRPSLQRFTRSSDPRVAERALDASWTWELERASSPQARLELLASRFAATDNPFRQVGGHPALWDRCVELAREARGPDDATSGLLADPALPLGLRVALLRGRALRTSDRSDAELADAAVRLAVETAQSARAALGWANRFELAHWKTLAWIATTGREGRAIARRAMDAQRDVGGTSQERLVEPLNLLRVYLDAHALAPELEAAVAELATSCSSSPPTSECDRRIDALLAATSAECLGEIVARGELAFALRTRLLARALGRDRLLALSLAPRACCEHWSTLGESDRAGAIAAFVALGDAERTLARHTLDYLRDHGGDAALRATLERSLDAQASDGGAVEPTD